MSPPSCSTSVGDCQPSLAGPDATRMHGFRDTTREHHSLLWPARSASGGSWYAYAAITADKQEHKSNQCTSVLPGPWTEAAAVVEVQLGRGRLMHAHSSMQLMPCRPVPVDQLQRPDDATLPLFMITFICPGQSQHIRWLCPASMCSSEHLILPAAAAISSASLQAGCLHLRCRCRGSSAATLLACSAIKQDLTLLDVVVCQGAAILQLLASKYEALLVRRNPLLVLDLALDVVDAVRRLHLQGDGLARQSFPAASAAALQFCAA